MVFLINSIPYIFVVVMGLVIRYAVPSKVGKAILGVLTIIGLLLYLQVQPTYMPKGEVKRSDVVFDYAVKELRESNLRKPVEVSVWDEKMKKEREEVEKRLGENKHEIESEKE